MKTVLAILSLIVLLFGTALVAKSPVNNTIIEGFKNGKAEMISKYFNETIELNAPNVEGLHSRDQANFILKEFFRNNTPKTFSIKHNGDSKNGSHYSIGELNTTKGIFRVYILFLNEGDKISITELRIEEDN